jgi:TPR repeat protein
MRSAKIGNTASQYNLGRAYYYGHCNVDRDESKAFYWYNESANGGDADAMFEVGQFYLQGVACCEDVLQAYQWIKKAAENKNPNAFYLLGYLYEMGHGTPTNLELAVENYSLALVEGITCDQDLLRAQAALSEQVHRAKKQKLQ